MSTTEKRARDVETTLAWRKANRERARELDKAYKKRNAKKVNARNRVYQAIKRGELERGPCEECGTTVDVHGHHHDYDKPLEVRWLCRAHHNEADNASRGG